jgi:hypothetical protein
MEDITDEYLGECRDFGSWELVVQVHGTRIPFLSKNEAVKHGVSFRSGVCPRWASNTSAVWAVCGHLGC